MPAVKFHPSIRVADWWLVAGAVTTFLALSLVREQWLWFAAGALIVAGAVGWASRGRKRFDRNWLEPWMRATILLLGVLSGVACIGHLWPVFGVDDRTASASTNHAQSGSSVGAAVDTAPMSTADGRAEQRLSIERNVAAINTPEKRNTLPPKVQEVLEEMKIPDKPVDEWTNEDRDGLQERILPIVTKQEGELPGLMNALCGEDAVVAMSPGCSVLAMILSGAGFSFGGGSTIREQVAALRALQVGNYDHLANLVAAEPWPPGGATGEMLDAVVARFHADRGELGKALSETSHAIICTRLSEATDRQKAQWRQFVVEQLDGTEELIAALVDGAGCK